MSIEAYSENSELTVRDMFIELAEIVCSDERRALQEYGRDMRGWEPLDPSLFPTPISLEQVVLEPGRSADTYPVTQATFHILGEDEAGITVSRNLPDTLDDDSYAQFILEQFSDSYFAHKHSFCLGIIRGMRMQKLKKQELIRTQARKQFSVHDKRRVTM